MKTQVAIIGAGMLAQGIADLLREARARMDREGHVHEGFMLSFNGSSESIDLKSLTGGKIVMVFG